MPGPKWADDGKDIQVVACGAPIDRRFQSVRTDQLATWLSRSDSGASRARTGDLLGAIQALFQLSYSPKCGVAPQAGGYLALSVVVRAQGI